MNPGKLNHRIRFAQLISATDQYGATTPDETPVVCSEIIPTDVTWGSLEPLSRVGVYNQLAQELGASVFNLSKILVLRYRKNFTPLKNMIFEDLNYPGDIYTVHSITPYYPGTKSQFQNNQQQVYKDNVFVFVVGIKRD